MTTDQSPPARPKRSWFQFSIKALLGLAVFVALACAALLNASEWWLSATFTLTLAVLLVAVLASIFRRGSTRAFWIGFAVVGCVYLSLSPAAPFSRLWLGGNFPLLTSNLSELAYSELHPTGWVYAPGDGQRQYRFVAVAHCLWTWLFAMFGGLLACYLYATREKES